MATLTEPAAVLATHAAPVRLGLRMQVSRESRRLATASTFSAAVHVGLVLLLGSWGIAAKPTPSNTALQVSVAAVEPPLEVIEKLLEPTIEERNFEPGQAVLVVSGSAMVAPVVIPEPKPSTARPQKLSAEQVDVDVFAQSPLLAAVDTGKYKTKLGQIRSAGQRMQAVIYRGGSVESEKAVALALVWIAKHQLPDGSWSFDHRTSGDCRGQCRHAGTMSNARIAATALAMLPFLAAGETHKQGRYKKEIDAGLKFLLRNMQSNGALTQGGGTMYSQALATVVLCELSAITRDRDLLKPSRTAMGYIVAAQDPRGGGWRYFPGMPGDTSVTGWQVMALKSADNAYHPVPPVSLEGARKFLDYVQQDGGSAYGYATPDEASTASTPVGLLCRMQMGWTRDEPALIHGVEALMVRGPLPNNMYYNFYATQVLHHFGGPHWTEWNKRMRDHLVRTQATAGHETGSWHFEEVTREDALAPLVGGRLYTTALAALTLEVYYRYLPLYGNRIFPDETKKP
ncbi:MAG: hypothetical protein C0483_06570 [Pirellula sp.]|nr:hypothetical protein [Pirellula sp.]